LTANRAVRSCQDTGVCYCFAEIRLIPCLYTQLRERRRASAGMMICGGCERMVKASPHKTLCKKLACLLRGICRCNWIAPDPVARIGVRWLGRTEAMQGTNIHLDFGQMSFRPDGIPPAPAARCRRQRGRDVPGRARHRASVNHALLAEDLINASPVRNSGSDGHRRSQGGMRWLRRR
jgi:hypothetical protein